MPQGLQIWNADGVLILDTNDRVGTFLGATTIFAGVDGSVTNTGFALGSFFFRCVSLTLSASFRPSFFFDTPTSTLSWAWQGRSGNNCSLLYGVW